MAPKEIPKSIRAQSSQPAWKWFATSVLPYGASLVVLNLLFPDLAPLLIIVIVVGLFCVFTVAIPQLMVRFRDKGESASD